MKTITQKQLDKEGITKDFLNSLDMRNSYSPVQLLPGDEPCRLLANGEGFWVKDEENDSYLKGKNGQLYVVTEKEARIGRARYILNFQEEIFEEEVQKELKRLQKKVESYLTPVLEKVKEALIMTGHLTDGLAIIRNAVFSMMSEEKKSEARKNAEKIVELFPLEKYNIYKEKIDKKDFDDIYQHIFTDGLPLLAEFHHEDVEEAKNLLHADNIHNTLTSTEGKSHLYKVAYFNVKRKESKQ